MAMTAHHGDRLRASWGRMAVPGAISLIGSVLALANSMAASSSATVLAGWVFTLPGALQLAQGERRR